MDETGKLFWRKHHVDKWLAGYRTSALEIYTETSYIVNSNDYGYRALSDGLIA